MNLQALTETSLFHLQNRNVNVKVALNPSELRLSRAGSSDTEAPFLDLGLSVAGGIVSSGIYDKRDDFNFEIVNFPFLGGDVPRSPSCGVCISQLVRFARVCSGVGGFGRGGLFLTADLLRQGCRYHKIRKAFSKIYHRHSELDTTLG